jgi:hypothetical protein
MATDGFGFTANQTFSVVDEIGGHKVSCLSSRPAPALSLHLLFLLRGIHYRSCYTLFNGVVQVGWALGSMLYEINGLPFKLEEPSMSDFWVQFLVTLVFGEWSQLTDTKIQTTPRHSI